MKLSCNKYYFVIGLSCILLSACAYKNPFIASYLESGKPISQIIKEVESGENSDVPGQLVEILMCEDGEV